MECGTLPSGHGLTLVITARSYEHVRVLLLPTGQICESFIPYLDLKRALKLCTSFGQRVGACERLWGSFMKLDVLSCLC